MSGHLTEQQVNTLSALWKEQVAPASASRKNNHSVMLREKYDQIVYALVNGNPGTGGENPTEEEAKQFRKGVGTKFYGWNQKYRVVTVNNTSKLFYRGKDGTALDNTQEVVPLEDAFNILYKIHVDNGHPKDRSLHKKVDTKYGRSITRSLCKALSDLCPKCQQASTRKPYQPGHTPIITKGFGSRGQVDLIDYQYLGGDNKPFNWLLTYQDHALKFLATAPLARKTPKDVAMALLEIFSTIGPPTVLQSDNGREFSGLAGQTDCLEERELQEVVSEIRQLWPGMTIVHGKPRHSASQGSIERANRHVELKLKHWMDDNKSNRWSFGHHIVRAQINSQYASSINTSPYEAVFGQRMRVGIADLPLDPTLLESLSETAVCRALGISDDSLTDGVLLHAQPKTATDDEEGVDEAEAIRIKLCNDQDAVANLSNDQDPVAERKRPLPVMILTNPPISKDEEKPLSPDGSTASEGSQHSTPSERSQHSVTDGRSVNTVCECGVDLESSGGAHSCRLCRRYMHAYCGQEHDGEGYGSTCICASCMRSTPDSEFGSSPNRIQRRRKASEALLKQASRMKRQTTRKYFGEELLQVGDVVQMAVPDVDRGKADYHNLTVVVVDIVKREGRVAYKVGSTKGVYKGNVSRNDLTVVKHADKTLLGLNTVTDIWKELPVVSLAKLATASSITGWGQGMVRCSCNGPCDTKRCTCKKADRKCNSRCHKSNSACTNVDQH